MGYDLSILPVLFSGVVSSSSIPSPSGGLNETLEIASRTWPVQPADRSARVVSRPMLEALPVTMVIVPRKLAAADDLACCSGSSKAGADGGLLGHQQKPS